MIDTLQVRADAPARIFAIAVYEVPTVTAVSSSFDAVTSPAPS